MVNVVNKRSHVAMALDYIDRHTSIDGISPDLDTFQRLFGVDIVRALKRDKQADTFVCDSTGVRVTRIKRSS